MTGIYVESESGVVQLTSTRNTLTLLGKKAGSYGAGDIPAGTKFVAKGATHEYAFGLPQSASSYGLVTRDASGAVLFDAIAYGRMAKPVGVMSGNIQSSAPQTKTSTFTSGRTYAVWITSPVSFIRVRTTNRLIGGVMNYFYHLDEQSMSVSISGATVSITASRVESSTENGATSSGPYEGAAKYDWSAIVLDVTGY